MDRDDYKPFTLHKKLDPWGMQPTEPDQAFARFVIYRDMGPNRTLLKVAERICILERDGFDLLSDQDKANAVESTHRVLRTQSSVYLWVSRARAYDAAMDAERRQARLAAEREEVREATARHAQIARGTLSLAAGFLQSLFDPSQPESKVRLNQRLADMTIGEFLALSRQGVTMEQHLLGIGREQEIDRAEAKMADRTPPADTPSREELRKIAAEAAADQIRNEPRPKKIKPPPEEEPDEPSVAGPDGE